MGELLTLPEIDSSQLKKSELSKYFSTLKRKEARIQARINLLKDREAQLRNLEQSIEQKLRKLEDEIAYFKQTQQKEKQVQQDRLEKLVNFYKKMRPKEAAPVFERMDRDLVVELFNRIPQKQTMNILAKMTPEKSVELSEYFGRIRSAKEYELLKEINTSLLEEFEECKRQP
jgi:flagellar motility protein MotE (MotC chaperone)